jgi:hypothetical protein
MKKQRDIKPLMTYSIVLFQELDNQLSLFLTG